MGLFSRLLEVVDHVKSLPKAVDDLTASIREATERNSHQSAVEQKENQRPIELRFPEDIEGQRKAETEEQIRIQCWIARGTWAAFIAATIYAGISLAQWREMKRQTVEANRAWISVDAPTFQQVAVIGQPVQIQIPYTNVGHGPGLDGKFSVLIDVINAPIVGGVLDATKLPNVGGSFCKTNPPRIQAGTIFPEPNPNTLRKSSGDFGIVWTPEMQRDEKLLRIRTCLVYDSFDEPRYTWTCKVFWSGAFVPNNPGMLIGFNCPDGGGAD